MQLVLVMMCVCACCSGGKPSSAFLSVVKSQRLLLECHSVTSASCHLVHARCAKILDVRTRAGLLNDLVPTDFLSLVQHVEDFVRQSAVITGVHCPNLRMALQSQAKSFLERFHDNSRKKIRYRVDISLETRVGWLSIYCPVCCQSAVGR